MLTDKEWCVYILCGVDPDTKKIMKTYIGISTQFESKRLRQHRGEIKGGAKSVARWNKKWLRLPCCVIRCPAFNTNLAERLEHLMKSKGSTRRRALSSRQIRKQIKECIPIIPIRSMFECLHWDEIHPHNITITWYLREHTPNLDTLSLLTPHPEKIKHVIAEQTL